MVCVRSGLYTLIAFSKTRKNELLFEYLTEQKDAENPRKVYIHESCRRDYVNTLRQDKIESTEEVSSTRTRSSASFFDWKHHCFYCGLEATEDTKHPVRNKVFNATFLYTKDKILEKCRQKLEMHEDEWVQQVQDPLLSCIDFVHAEARSHGEYKTRLQLKNNAKPGTVCSMNLRHWNISRRIFVNLRLFTVWI